MRAPLALLATLLTAAALAPTAGGHVGTAIEVEAREAEACLDTDVCLELVRLPPDLGPGHETALSLRVHANATDTYRASAASLELADPDREATPDSAAVATTPAVEPGGEARVNMTTPEAPQLYLWLPDDDHEARGGWERLPLTAQADDARQPADSLGAASLLPLALAAIAIRRARRRG